MPKRRHGGRAARYGPRTLRPRTLPDPLEIFPFKPGQVECPVCKGGTRLVKSRPGEYGARSGSLYYGAHRYGGNPRAQHCPGMYQPVVITYKGVGG